MRNSSAVIERLKSIARKAYYEAAEWDMTYGGRAMYDQITGSDTVGALARYDNAVLRLRRVDPTCPK